MSMSRRDYESVADVFRRHITQAVVDRDPLGHRALVAAALDLADVLAESNETFDRERFLAACGANQMRTERGTKQ